MRGERKEASGGEGERKRDFGKLEINGTECDVAMHV